METYATHLGVVAGVDGPVHCGWVSMSPQVCYTPVNREPPSVFKPFDLMKGRRCVARVAALEGVISERVVPQTRLVDWPDAWTGPMRDFLVANDFERPRADAGENRRLFKVSVRGAVFRDGEKIAVIGRTTGHVVVGRREVPLVTAIAIGVEPKALRHARELALGLGVVTSD
jgi:hypothetical protein